MKLIVENIGWYPYPYIKYAKLGDDASKYFGHKWYVAIHILWWDVMLVKFC